jgi:hypothetical protein
MFMKKNNALFLNANGPEYILLSLKKLDYFPAQQLRIRLTIHRPIAFRRRSGIVIGLDTAQTI